MVSLAQPRTGGSGAACKEMQVGVLSDGCMPCSGALGTVMSLSGWQKVYSAQTCVYGKNVVVPLRDSC